MHVRKRRTPRPEQRDEPVIKRSKNKQRTCFNCGYPANISIQSKQIKKIRYICKDQGCWTKYWEEADGSGV